MSETLEVLQSRQIKIYSTLAQNLRTIETTARNAGELMADMDREGIPYRGMSMVIGETAQGLVGNTSALLPGEQTILLMPIEVKSGSWEPEEDDSDNDWNDDDEEEQEEISYSRVMSKHEAVTTLRRAAQSLSDVADYLESTQERVIVNGPVDSEIERLNRMAANIQQGMNATAHIAASPNVFD